jgi:hypothetical protein
MAVTLRVGSLGSPSGIQITIPSRALVSSTRYLLRVYSWRTGLRGTFHLVPLNSEICQHRSRPLQTKSPPQLRGVLVSHGDPVEDRARELSASWSHDPDSSITVIAVQALAPLSGNGPAFVNRLHDFLVHRTAPRPRLRSWSRELSFRPRTGPTFVRPGCSPQLGARACDPRSRARFERKK